MNVERVRCNEVAVRCTFAPCRFLLCGADLHRQPVRLSRSMGISFNPMQRQCCWCCCGASNSSAAASMVCRCVVFTEWL